MSVRCAHILQKHKESRRPVDSFRNKQITRSREEARANIQAFLNQLRDNPSPKLFSEIAMKYSECSSCQKGGDLGFFERGDMQKAFEDAAFKLNVGEISGIVSTDSGEHIIMRLG